MMPRKKLPVEELLKSGTANKKPIKTRFSAFGMDLLDEVPPAPDFCKQSKLADRVWREIVPELVKTHRLAKEDLLILEEVVRGFWYLDMIDLTIARAERVDALVIQTIQQRQRVLAKNLELFAKFGITPSERQKLAASFLLERGAAGEDSLTKKIFGDDEDPKN